MFSVYLDDPDERCGPGDLGLHRFGSIEDAQRAAEEHFGGPLYWPEPTRGEQPSPGPGSSTYLIEEAPVTTAPEQDLQTLIQTEIAKAIGQLAQDVDAVVAQQPPLPTFEDVLAQVDPRDSEAALAMLDFLLKTGRLGRVGVLDGGHGYLFTYAEPKGTTKAGYRPGATQGDRIVDAAVDKQRAEGVKPVKQGVCGKCVSAIYQKDGDAAPRLADEEDFTKAVVCPADGDMHAFA